MNERKNERYNFIEPKIQIPRHWRELVYSLESRWEDCSNFSWERIKRSIRRERKFFKEWILERTLKWVKGVTFKWLLGSFSRRLYQTLLSFQNSRDRFHVPCWPDRPSQLSGLLVLPNVQEELPRRQ